MILAAVECQHLVPNSVMPKGVEHDTRAVCRKSSARGAEFSDAERR